MSTEPAATGSATVGSKPGSMLASQSMKHTISEVAVLRPAKHADPKPLIGDCCTKRTSELSRTVGGTVVDDDRPVARWHSLEYPWNRVALVEYREDDIDHAHPVSQDIRP
jgi:hypothetical protein